MSNLNTSNITVPSVATMVQHLVDSDPHPQYLLGSNLLSAVSANIHLGDLADVNLGTGIPDNSLIVYNNGVWSNVTASTLIESTIIPYATTINAGIVRLTTSNGVQDAADSSSVITPATLAAWGSGKGFISSGNFYTVLAENLSAHWDIKDPLWISLEQLKNVEFDYSNPKKGQYLVIKEYDTTTSRPIWTNSTLETPIAKSTQFGVVKVATTAEVMYGTSKTYNEMEISGHSVPSVASLKDLMGTTFVSRVASDGTSEVYSSIQGHTSSIGITSSGTSTIINARGLVTDHIVSGGVVTAQGGPIIGVSIAGIDVTTAAGTTHVSGLLNVSGSGTAYNVNIGKYGNVIVTDADVCDVTFLTGEYTSTWDYINMSNTMTVGSNGHAHQVVVGYNYDSETLSRLIAHDSNMNQGVLNVNSRGVVEHCIVNGCGNLNVNAYGRVYHATLRGSKSLANVKSNGYIEGGALYSGASVVISTGGEVNGLTVFESAYIEVQSGAYLYGLVKYAGCNIVSSTGAYIQKVGFVTDDKLVYSSSTTDWNVKSDATSGLVLAFSANAHPTGLRKEITDSSTMAVTHKFYPMAAATRQPNSVDKELNDYTMNISGLDLWNDIFTSNSYVKWYITF